MRRPMKPPAGFSPLKTAGKDRLSDIDAFGTNPGNLRARFYAPKRAAGPMPLVVVLHGCTQTAAGYDAGSGWSALADELGFLLLFPEQQRANNPNLCFNWFTPNDIRRDEGEALSIRQMIDAMVRDHGADPARIFVTGLSAGGAMTSVMLATYPDVFAGGAIIAGLPYGSAHGVPQALDRMQGRGTLSADALAALVRNASPHAGPWPTISIWHGGGDTTVTAANADAIVAQWRSIHGVADAPSVSATVDGYPHRIWRDAAGRAVIERYDITGMGHGTPLSATGDDRCGTAGPFMLEAGISSTRRIAAFWGLASAGRAARAAAAEPRVHATMAAGPIDSEMVSPDHRTATLPVRRSVRPERMHTGARRDEAGSSSKGVGKIIEDALRAAGLMR